MSKELDALIALALAEDLAGGVDITSTASPVEADGLSTVITIRVIRATGIEGQGRTGTYCTVTSRDGHVYGGPLDRHSGRSCVGIPCAVSDGGINGIGITSDELVGCHSEMAWVAGEGRDTSTITA